MTQHHCTGATDVITRPWLASMPFRSILLCTHTANGLTHCDATTVVGPTNTFLDVRTVYHRRSTYKVEILYTYEHTIYNLFIEKVPAFIYYTTTMCRSPRKRCLNYAQLTLTVESGAQTTPQLPDTQTYTDGMSHELTHQPDTPSANLFPKPAPIHLPYEHCPENDSSTLFSEDI